MRIPVNTDIKIAEDMINYTKEIKGLISTMIALIDITKEIQTQGKRKEITRQEKIQNTGEKEGRADNMKQTGESCHEGIEFNIDNYSEKPSKYSSPI